QRAGIRGSLRMAGRELTALDESAYRRLRGRELAMVFQEPMTALNPVQTIGAQIGESLRLHLGLNRHEADRRSRHLLERVGLPVARFPPSRYPHQLSGGQRQRVVIAMALACHPKLLIADEPTTALDVTIQAQILDLLAELVAEDGMGLLLITHDLGVVAEMTDRVAVMYAGHIVEQAATTALFRHMAHPYSHGLLRAVPTLHGATGQRLEAIPGRVPDLHERPQGCSFAPRCPRVRPHCGERFPPRVPLEPGHGVACYHPLWTG
ncbi:MAG: ABC transporter ATP-binding protein, partial [Candidatus Competibacterales bacterium]|nr:ABC transporter ATP-binding protein [Candidatus Competibacterales bacterium]